VELLRPKVSAVIPAYNEEETIAEVVEGALRYVDEVIVVDDGSLDKTAEKAHEAGARVVEMGENRGILQATVRGFREAEGEIIVTLDADGQHNPDEIPRLLEPILRGEADLVLGRRPNLPHLSERIIAWLTGLKVQIHDASTGFRAMRRWIAENMRLRGGCLCGILILEAHRLGARIAEVPISIRERRGERRMRTRHIRQIFYILLHLLGLL